MKRLLLLCLLLWACPKEEAKPPEPAKKAEVIAPKKAAPAQEPPAEAPLPVQADFEEAAETEITAANYKASLDALEKELAE